MGLFDKKYCDICGEKIGLLGNRKLEDGNMCKDCARKLSPFFSDRRSSTIEEIKQQLAYREKNKQILAGFSAVMNYGDNDKVYVDTNKGNFLVSDRTPGIWSDENPDVIPLSSVMSCNLRVDEDKDEIYTQNNNGEQVSYNPPRYQYFYDFYIDIKVNNPYFDDIEVKLNNSQVEGMGSMEYNRYQQMAQQVIGVLMQTAPNTVNMGMNQGYAPANGYQQNPYGQSMQQNPYSQPMQQNPYSQPMPQNPYGQPMQQNPYGQPAQQNPYGQPPASQNWVCPACNGANAGGNFCSFCGAPKR